MMTQGQYNSVAQHRWVVAREDVQPRSPENGIVGHDSPLHVLGEVWEHARSCVQ